MTGLLKFEYLQKKIIHVKNIHVQNVTDSNSWSHACAKISRTEGVPADSYRSCSESGKLLARNTKIDGQIYLSTAGKGLSGILWKR